MCWSRAPAPSPTEHRRQAAVKGWVERVNGIEPSYAAWEAAVLPLNYTREERDSSEVWAGPGQRGQAALRAAPLRTLRHRKPGRNHRQSQGKGGQRDARRLGNSPAAGREIDVGASLRGADRVVVGAVDNNRGVFAALAYRYTGFWMMLTPERSKIRSSM